jgi:hypothetical protein
VWQGQAKDATHRGHKIASRRDGVVGGSLGGERAVVHFFLAVMEWKVRDKIKSRDVVWGKEMMSAEKEEKWVK